MKIKLHGGDCCGIKIIHSLGTRPSGKIAAREALDKHETSYGQDWLSGHNDMRSKNLRGDCDFFNVAAPAMTYKERFILFVEFIKSKRPNGLIEVVIGDNQGAWKAVLGEQGFKMVSEATNSNSLCTIHIYHLVY